MNIDSQSILHMYKMEVPHSVEEANQILSCTPFKKTERKFDRAVVLFWWTKLFRSGLPNEVIDSWLKASKDIFLYCRPDDGAVIKGFLSMALYISQTDNYKKQLNQVKLWIPLVSNQVFRVYTHAERGNVWTLSIKPKNESDLIVDGRLHKSFPRLSKSIIYLQRNLWFRHPKNLKRSYGPSNRRGDAPRFRRSSVLNAYRTTSWSSGPIVFEPSQFETSAEPEVIPDMSDTPF